MNNLKNKTSTALLNYYSENPNLANFINVARKMLVVKGTSPLIRGEICEIVLEIILKEFMNKNKNITKDWILEGGLIINDKNNPTSDYLTEIDRVLFTPRMIYVFECKSYKGEKLLKDKGSLYVKKGNKFSMKLDVFEQNRKHSVALLKYILPSMKNKSSDNKLVKMAMFDFSIGEYTDRREDKFKGIFPLVDDKTVLNLFKGYSSKDECWDMEKLKGIIESLNIDKSKKVNDHLNYVKGIKR